MRLPEPIIDRVPVLALLEEDWDPVSNRVLIAWIVFYIVVLAGAAGGGGLALWIDLVFVPIHEGGHLLFSWLGSHWLMVAGGTFLQLFVPFALAVYFAFRREIPRTAFCAFFFFEQFLPVGIYMADSRSQSLQYVTVGDPDKAEHDWRDAARDRQRKRVTPPPTCGETLSGLSRFHRPRQTLSDEIGGFEVVEENVTEGPTSWLCLRVKPSGW